LGDAPDVTVPVALSTETPLPIVVESVDEFERVQSLLTTFPETPAVSDQLEASNEEDEPGLTSVSGVTEADAEVSVSWVRKRCRPSRSRLRSNFWVTSNTWSSCISD